MRNMMIACFDVHYYQDYARASCIVFDKKEEKVIAEYMAEIKGVKDYLPGQFYQRELPCILRVLKKVKENIDLIIIDGFIWVKGREKGLGAHFYQTINCKTPIIGVAKSYLNGSTAFVSICRGQSSKPLYVSAIGIDLNYAARLIKNLKGDFRIPDILKKVDKLARNIMD